ncbi:hypothetical protein TRM7557_02657 [Tritonibacter multivorans]|uniref:Phytase-like domain-containing protein n=2 Tax=Tritonibacter multivorans TaxID=928856 RepID=A0A0P1GEU5_9RHOB|nr:esterase-like activity of phytase family protein [Tritonibacter multivorans]CUH79954.1 hypothetical protein TRM7557_02657 [Tritonibacter multivorans]SFB98995.1 hypothetical protein SAMN04488049_10161 [Tritonibacter multivorans]
MRTRSALKIAVAVCMLAPASWAAERFAPGVTHLQSYRWHIRAPWFGGLSGLEVSDDGAGFTVLNDKAQFFKARIARDSDGRIDTVAAQPPVHLRAPDGKPLSSRLDDTEGLAIAADGTIFVSLESPPSALHYTAPSARATALPRPRAFWHARRNKSFEALAISPDGALVMLSELPAVPRDPLRVWVWNGAVWASTFNYPQTQGFMPVGADFGPDGRLYVLERSFASIGFRSRLRRFNWGAGQLSGATTLLETSVATHDNLEAVSIWRDSQGSLRATMISDDNFLWIQRTEIVEYQLPD